MTKRPSGLLGLIALAACTSVPVQQTAPQTPAATLQPSVDTEHVGSIAGISKIAVERFMLAQSQSAHEELWLYDCDKKTLYELKGTTNYPALTRELLGSSKHAIFYQSIDPTSWLIGRFKTQFGGEPERLSEFTEFMNKTQPIAALPSTQAAENLERLNTGECEFELCISDGFGISYISKEPHAIQATTNLDELRENHWLGKISRDEVRRQYENAGFRITYQQRYDFTLRPIQAKTD